MFVNIFLSIINYDKIFRMIDNDAVNRIRERETFYLTTNSTHFIYGYMASDIWLRTILIVRKQTRCCHIGYSYRLTARVLLYAPSHRQDNTYHGLCYTSRGGLAGTRNSSMGPPHEGLIRRPIAWLLNTSRSVTRTKLKVKKCTCFIWKLPPVGFPVLWSMNCNLRQHRRGGRISYRMPIIRTVSWSCWKKYQQCLRCLSLY